MRFISVQPRVVEDTTTMRAIFTNDLAAVINHWNDDKPYIDPIGMRDVVKNHIFERDVALAENGYRVIYSKTDLPLGIKISRAIRRTLYVAHM